MKNISRFSLLVWAHSIVFPLFFHATINGCDRRGFSTNLMEINGSDKKFSICLKWMKQAEWRLGLLSYKQPQGGTRCSAMRVLPPGI